MKKYFTEQQVIRILKEAKAGGAGEIALPQGLRQSRPRESTGANIAAVDGFFIRPLLASQNGKI